MDKIKELLTQIKTVAEASGVEVKANLETKANEVIHSTNTGFGKELMEQASQSSDIIDMTIANSNLLQTFRGNHGKTIPLAGAKVPVIGDTAFYSTASEWTTGAILSQVTQGTYRLPTAEITIIPKKYKMTCDISDEQLKNPLVNIESIVMDRLSKGAVKTIEAVLLNGDTVTASTGNINSDDGAPTAGIYYLNQNGLRKEALSGTTGVDKIDIGALTWSDFVDIQSATGYLGTNPTDWVWIMELKTQTKALQLEEYKKSNENGRLSSIVLGRGAVNNVLGSDVIVPRDLRLTEADGKISTTASNNTKGQVLYVHKDAVQYGFSGDYTFETMRVPGVGIQVIGVFYFGFAIVDKLAGETDPTCVLGYNITV